MVDYVAKLRKEIAKTVRQEVNKVARTTGLAQSSIHGTGLDVYDEAGNFLTSVVTSKGDGGYGVGYNIDSTVITPEGIESPSIKSNAITADKLEAMLVLASMIIAGDPAGAAAIMDQTGFRTTAVSNDGEQYTSTRLGTADGSDALEIIPDSEAPPVAAISADGDGSFATVTVAAGDINIAGSPLLGTMVDRDAAPALLDNWPRGTVAMYSLRDLPTMSASVGGATASESQMGQFEFTLPPNRSYTLEMPWRCNPSVYSGTTPSNLSFSVRARYTFSTDGSTPADPTTDSLVAADSSMRVPANGSTGVGGILKALVATDNNTWRVKMCVDIYAAAGASVTPSVYDLFSWIMTITDTGPIPTILPAASPGGTSTRQYTTTWTATDSRAWRSDTGAQAGGGTKATMWQGITSGVNVHSAFVCNGNATAGDEVGKTMATALAGATIAKVEIGVQSVWWQPGFGTLGFGVFTGSTLPATHSGAPANPRGGVYTARSQWQWTAIDNSVYGISATNRGIYLSDGGVGFPSTSGSFAGSSHATVSQRPQIRVTYIR